MRIAIVGSRTFGNLDLVKDYVMGLPMDDAVISGGAEGVDQMAIKTAKTRGMGIRTFLPEWKTFGKTAGAIRNQQIVEYADRVVAFWDKASKGTKITIDMAVKAEKPVNIFDEDGTMVQV